MPKKNTIRMERRYDLPTHPDDIVKPKKPRKKHTKRGRPNFKKHPQKDEPWVQDLDVWKAVQFARSIINSKNRHQPIELAMHIAAKHYKVNPKEVAREMGRFGSHCREKYKKTSY